MINLSNYYSFTRRTKELITNSRKEWKIIDNEHNKISKIVKEYILPLSIICSIVVFLGSLFRFNYALWPSVKMSIITIVSIFLSIYTSSAILNEFINSIKDIKKDNIKKVVIYACGVFFVFHTLSVIFYEDGFIKSIFQLSQFICGIPIFTSIDTALNLKREKAWTFTIFITILITGIPNILEQILERILNIPIASI